MSLRRHRRHLTRYGESKVVVPYAQDRGVDCPISARCNRLVRRHSPDVFARKGCKERGIGWRQSEEESVATVRSYVRIG